MLTLLSVCLNKRLKHISGQIEPNKITHLIGPNGAGKSTLLAVMAGMLTPDNGSVRYIDNGINEDITQLSLHELARFRGYLVQQQLPAMDIPVYQYIYAHYQGVASSVVETTIIMLTDKLLLTDKLPRRISQLSGGEWQRVRLVSVFLQVWPTINPAMKLLFLDEPMTALDVAHQVIINDLLKTLIIQGVTIIMTGHDLNHTLCNADNVWVISEGLCIAYGNTDSIMTEALLSSTYGVPFKCMSIEGRKILLTP
ncbi:MAG: vitamin B12 ABC transporter ATP-binding protein BtuD [Plesiomonas sp.]|uniref:vitamin B12 ABC transporter ATP-binding protein BtuD n=1 Tax=Plesiomonas sp. TaxID=2486279 RepID=UPI003F39B729